MSNSQEVMTSIPDELCADSEDVFQFQLGFHKVKKAILDGESPTKRQMCGLIMSLFDPMDFIAQFKIKGIILYQEVWNSGIRW